MTSDHMLTTEQLEAIARSIRAGAVPGQDKLSALLSHVEDLQHRVDFLENMYLERRTDHEEALAAQKRAERLAETLKGISEQAEYIKDDLDWQWVAKVARAALEEANATR